MSRIVASRRAVAMFGASRADCLALPRWLGLTALVGAGCAPAPSAAEPPRGAVVVELAPPPAAGLAVATGRAPLELPALEPGAPLLELATRTTEARQLLQKQHFVAGHQFGIVSTSSGAFVVDQRGVFGPILAPGAEPVVAAMPIRRDGAVLVLTATGKLHETATLASALRGEGYVQRGVLFAPVAFDAAEDVVVLAEARAVHVSLDAGASFARVELPVDQSVAEVFARADGVVVVVARATNDDAKRTVLVSRRASKLAPSTYQAHDLARRGGVIHTRWGCAAALTADGSTWWAPHWMRTGACTPLAQRKPKSTARGEQAVLDDEDDPLGVAPYAIPFLRLTRWPSPKPPTLQPTPTVPATPKLAPPGQRAVGPSPETGVLGGLGYGGGGGGRLEGVGSTSCAGATCLSHAPFPLQVPGRHELWAFDDAVCEAKDVTPVAPGARWNRCAAGAVASRSASLAVLDHTTGALRTVGLPPDCRHEAWLQSRSLMLVPCVRRDGTSLELVTPDGRATTLWRALGGPSPKLVDVSDDGTVVVSLGRSVFAVRDPSRSGVASLRTLESQALLALPLRGGHALVAKGVGPRGEQLELGIDVPGKGHAPLGGPIDLRGEHALGLELRDDRTVVVLTHPTQRALVRGLHNEAPRRMLVMNDGTLEPIVDATPVAGPASSN